MSDRIRWGILSTANIGRKRVIPAIKNARNGDVVAIASRSLDSAQAAAAELHIPTAHGSYEALLADPNVDAIYNPLPNHLHAEWSIKAAEAGKPTLCEKPLAVDAAEAQTMVDVFAAHGIPFAEAFMYRFHPQTDQVKDMLEDGAVGEVRVIQSTFTFAIHREDNIRLQKAMAGGALMDVGCYCVNAMRYLTGEEPDEVHARARFGPVTGVDESLVGVLAFPGGALGHFDCSLRTYRENNYEIRGSKGRIVVPVSFTPDPGAETTIHYWGEEGYEVISIPGVDQYQLMVEDFAEALLESRPVRFAPQDAVANMQVIDRLLASARGSAAQGSAAQGSAAH